MAMNQFEKEILRALKVATGNNKLREKDMLEWRMRPIDPQKGEDVWHLDSLGVWVAIPAQSPK